MTNPVPSADQLSADDGPVFERRIGDETVVETVLSAVSAVTDADVLGTPAELARDSEGTEPLPSLYDAVDPDALSKLFSKSVGDDVAVTFPYAGCTVTVTGSDTVLVRERSPATE